MNRVHEEGVVEEECKRGGKLPSPCNSCHGVSKDVNSEIELVELFKDAFGDADEVLFDHIEEVLLGEVMELRVVFGLARYHELLCHEVVELHVERSRHRLLPHPCIAVSRRSQSPACR